MWPSVCQACPRISQTAAATATASPAEAASRTPIPEGSRRRSNQTKPAIAAISAASIAPPLPIASPKAQRIGADNASRPTA
jgi:hypothetical protein